MIKAGYAWFLPSSVLYDETRIKAERYKKGEQAVCKAKRGLRVVPSFVLLWEWRK